MSKLVLLLLLSTAGSAAQDQAAIVRQWLPIHVGDRWTYEEETLDGSQQHPDVNKWEEEVQTVAVQAVAEGLLISRTIRFLNKTASPSYLGEHSESNILIRKNCIYYLNDSDSFSPDYGWDSTLHKLGSNFQRDLANDKALPDVCFPISSGVTWGDPNIGRDLWTVVGLGRLKPDDPSSVTPDSWRLESNLSSGDDNRVWFQKGVGITAKRTTHNGTFAEHRLRLIRFHVY